jgi:hypothetical protein
MKEKKFNKTGTKMLVDTGWKTFDRQTNVISTGNVVSNTQFSMYIRPFGETECNGTHFRPGELLDFDMKPFRKYYDVPSEIMRILYDKDRNDSLILYMFRTFEGTKPVPFLWVITTKHPEYRLVHREVVYYMHQRYTKRLKAADEILKYITED